MRCSYRMKLGTDRKYFPTESTRLGSIWTVMLICFDDPGWISPIWQTQKNCKSRIELKMSFAFDCLMASARLAWITIHDDTINLQKDNWKLLAKLLAVTNHYWLWLNKHCIGFPYAVQSCEANAPSWIEHLPKVNDFSSSHWDGHDLSLRTSVNWLFKRHCVLEKTLSCKNAFS